MNVIVEQNINRTLGMAFIIRAQKFEHVYYSKNNHDVTNKKSTKYLICTNIQK